MDFADFVRSNFKEPLESLREALMNAGEMEQYLFFSGIVDMSYEPGDEFSVIAASIKLSRCSFLGFQYSPAIQAQVNQILDQAITISAPMSSVSLQ